MRNAMKVSAAVAGGATAAAVATVVFFAVQPAISVEQCVAFDQSNWSQAQRNHLRAVSIYLLGNAGHSAVVTEPTQGTICANLPGNVQLDSILTVQALQQQWNAMLAQWEQQQQDADELANAREAERAANIYCQQDIDAVEAAIDTMYDGATTQAQILNRTKLALKVLARCMWAHRG